MPGKRAQGRNAISHATADSADSITAINMATAAPVTTAATMLMCNPIVFGIMLVLFVIIVAIWRFISLGSIMCALLYPVILNFVDKLLVGGSGVYIVFPILIAVMVTLKHKDNIKRLLEGKENKLEFKKSVDRNKK